MRPLVLASISMNSRGDRNDNLRRAFDWVRKASDMGAEWVQLPEVFSYHGPYDGLAMIAEPDSGPLWQSLSELARSCGVVLFAGTVPEQPEAHLPRETRVNRHGQSRVYNTLYVFDRDGRNIGKYRKTHLFNLLAPDGQPQYTEGDGFIPGDELSIIPVDGYQVGLTICYDLRFPELYAAMHRKSPMDVLVIPSAFTVQTGMAHWEILLRARAIEHQCYVYAANLCGTHLGGKASYGHSMIVDPWGHKIADTGDGEGIALGILDPGLISACRTRLPALANKRPEIYG